MPGVEMRQDVGVHVVAPAAGRYNLFEKDAVSQKLKPWDALRAKYAASANDVVSLMRSVKATFPFLREGGVCYNNFKSASPSARAGTVHITGLNPFSAPCFSGSLYWSDVRVCVHNICANGGFSKSIAIYPIYALSGIKVPPQENGALAYGADGAYSNRVRLWSVCFVAYTIAVDQLLQVAKGLFHDLAAIRATRQRHASNEARTLYILKETAVAAKENRLLDPFLLVGLLLRTYALSAESVRSVISKHNRNWSFNSRMQLQGKAVQRVCDLGVETSTVASNYEEMESMVETHGYYDGPWCDVFFSRRRRLLHRRPGARHVAQGVDPGVQGHRGVADRCGQIHPQVLPR